MTFEIINNELDYLCQKITQEELANVIEKDRTTVSKFLMGQSELGFWDLLKIIKYIAPGKEEELMLRICKKCVRPNNKILAMEYLAETRNFEDLKELIDHQDIPKKWRDIYNIIYLLETNAVSNAEILDMLYKNKIADNDIIFLAKYIRARIHSRNFEFSPMLSLSRSMNYHITKMKDGFLKNSFLFRTNELSAWIDLFYYDDKIKSREKAFYCIEKSFCSKMNSRPYYILGMSFVFETPVKAIQYFSESKKLQPEIAAAIERKDLAFTKIHWGIDLGSVNLGDISERAHFEARWGDKEKAKELLKKAVEQQGESPFKTYYLGLAAEDDGIMFEALTKFLNDGNKFFANLPKKHLMKSETYSKATEIMFGNFNIA